MPLGLDRKSVVCLVWFPLIRESATSVSDAESPFWPVLLSAAGWPSYSPWSRCSTLVSSHGPSRPTGEMALLFLFSLIPSPHIKQTATTKRFMHVDFGSLKNDPEQSCFFTLIMKSNIHEMDFPLQSPTHSGHRCVFAGVFSLCLHSLVRLARVNGILKAHFQATQLITQGWRMTLPYITCLKQRRVGAYLGFSKIGVRVKTS